MDEVEDDGKIIEIKVQSKEEDTKKKEDEIMNQSKRKKVVEDVKTKQDSSFWGRFLVIVFIFCN